MKNLKKIIIPVAGLGTRLLPATKAIPKKCFLLLVPIIQHVVEEAKEAGFKEIIFITHPVNLPKRSLDTSYELEAALDKRIKRSLLKETKTISKLGVSIQSVRQGEAQGLGHAILVARNITRDEPFAILLPDMLIQNQNSLNNLGLMKKKFEENKTSSILFSSALKKDIHKYGIAQIKKIKNFDGIGLVEKIIEKPNIKNAPSNLFAAGRYIFTPEIMKYLAKIVPNKNDEVELTEAIDLYIKDGGQVLGYKLNGKVFDCGDKLGYSIANIEFSKSDPEIGISLKKIY